MKIDFAYLISLAHDNNKYRKVVDTTTYSQTVVMCLIENEDIPTEIHESTTQIIYVVDGLARIETDVGKAFVGNDQMYVIPPNTKHYIQNASEDSLKLISIYLPAEHRHNKIDLRQPNKCQPEAKQMRDD